MTKAEGNSSVVQNPRLLRVDSRDEIAAGDREIREDAAAERIANTWVLGGALWPS
jgi:hypothetical protein